MRHSVLRYAVPVFAVALLTAACGDGDDTTTTTSATKSSGSSTPDGSDGDSTTSSGRGGEATLEGLADLAGQELRDAQSALVAPIAADPFTCQEAPAGEAPAATATGVTADAVKVAFLEADLKAIEPLGLAVDLGPEGARFEALAEIINECGGINGRTLDVTVYPYNVASIDEQRAACTKATAEDGNFIIVTRVFIQDMPLCVTETNETILVMNSSATGEFYERSDGRLITLNASEDRIAENAMKVFEQEGIVGPDTTVGLVWGDVVDQNVLVDNTLREGLAATGATVVEAPIEQANALSCTGQATAVQQMMAESVDTVLAIMGGPCYGDLVIEATNQGFFPQWLTIDKSGMTSNVGTSKMSQAGDGFEGAVGVSLGRGQLGLEGESEVPYAWDKACADLTNERNNESVTFPSDPYAAATGPCTSLYLIAEAVKLAGTELTQESFLDAVDNLGVVPGSGDAVFTGFSRGLREGPDDAAYLLKWSLECECWAEVSEPVRAG